MLASVSESRVEELRGEGVGASRATMASQRPHLRLPRCEQRPELRGGVPVGKGAEDQGEVREKARVLHVDDQGAVWAPVRSTGTCTCCRAFCSFFSLVSLHRWSSGNSSWCRRW